MACTNCNKASNMCGDKMFAPCITVEKEFPEFSKLFGEECTSLDIVLDDIYELIDELRVDYTLFNNSCLEHADDLSIESILLTHDAEICNLITDVSELQNICNILNKDIRDCDLNFTCLLGTDECDNTITITSLNSLLQVMIDKICKLENPA